MKISHSSKYTLICDRVFLADEKTASVKSLRMDVTDGKFASISPWINSSSLPMESEVFDLRGYTILPLLTDPHVHVYMNPWPFNPKFRAQPGSQSLYLEIGAAKKRMNEAFLAGIGLLRDLGDPLGINSSLVEYSNQALDVSQLLSAGHGYFREGRYGRFIGSPVKDLDSLLEKIRKAAKDPLAHLIKLIPTGIINFKKGCVTTPPQFTLNELQKAVDLSHELGKKVSAHCSGEDGVLIAIDAGVDFIEHGYFINKASVEKLAKKGAAWTPTLAPVYVQWNHASACGWDEETREHLRHILDQHVESLRYGREIGVRIMAGSDAGGVGVSHGEGLWLELQLMHQAGFPIPELLKIASRQAQWIGEKTHGVIAEGAQANFSVFKKTVDLDLKEYRSIHWVVKNGQIFQGTSPLSESDSVAEKYGMPSSEIADFVAEKQVSL